MTNSPQSAHFFLSYSRRQFYFAEAVVLGLQEAGMDMWFDVQQLGPGEPWREDIQRGLDEAQGVVLIASRASMASKYVRAEWEPMIETRRPVYILLFEACDIPQELLDADTTIIDMRGNFKRNLNRLIEAIQGKPTLTMTKLPRRLPLDIPTRLPLTVGVMVLVLALFLAFLLVALYGIVFIQDDVNFTLFEIALVLFMLFLTGDALYDLLRRQHRFIQLWILLGIVTFAFSFAGSPVREIAFGIMGILGLTYALSPGTYRWLPTGEAPKWMRNRYGAGAAPTIRDTLRNLDETNTPRCQRYTISYAEEDEWIAAQIDEILNEDGHERIGHQSTFQPDDEHIVVLSHYTEVRDLIALMEKHPDRLTPVLAANVDAREAIDNIGDYQFIDFRQHANDQLRAISTFYRHPEEAQIIYGNHTTPLSANRVLYPAWVRRFNIVNHILLMAYFFFAATLLVPLVYAAARGDTLEYGSLSFAFIWGGVVLALGLVHAHLAHQINTRQITYRGFRRRLLLAGGLSFILAGFGVPQLVLFLMGAQVMHHWLPQDIAPDKERGLPLTNQHTTRNRILRDCLVLAVVLAVYYADGLFGVTI
ncbi:MAG: toll/interleukin-1 receptor domain-containing protein [Chloroflexota bacterium]